MIKKKNKRKPLLKCEVIHSIDGRIRLGCRAFKYLFEQKEEIEKKIQNIKSIKSAKISVVTKNILIYYGGDSINQEEIIGIVEDTISLYSMIAYKGEREDKTKVSVKERSIQEEPVEDILKRIVSTTAVIGYSLFNRKNKVISKGILGKFTTIPAIASIGLSLPIIKSGISSLRNSYRPNADALTATSIITSILAGKDSSALTIILLSDIAELLTSYTMSKTRNSIKDMLSLNEEFVWLQLDDKTVKKVQISSIKKDDLVVVHTGEKICVDGEVISGEAVVDQAAVTGEFMPAIKRKEEKVFAGTVVKNGTITIKTEKAGDDTAVARIIHLVEEASHRKASIQAYADNFSAYLIPFNFILAGITYMVTKSSSRALNMMIIDYSCGVRLSTATAFSAAINTAVRNGILIKGGNYIERLAESDTLILDKTGTLTEGKPQVLSIIPANKDISEKEVIEIAAAAEETSNHPMAIAVLSKLRQSDWDIPVHGKNKVHIARGIETTIGEDKIYAGSKVFMLDNDVDISILEDEVKTLISNGEGIIYVARNNQLVGILGIQDKLRDNMKKAINKLRYQGIDDIALLTGDLKEQAEIVANKMAVDRYEAQLLPEDKAKQVLSIQSKGSKVIMVGDGINDAPALAYSDVGVAIGGGMTDVAMEASDVTIQSDNPMLLPGIVDMSNKTMNIVKQNFGMAIGINTIGLLLGAVGTLPVFWGAVLHNSSTILVIANSLRLLVYDVEKR
ncbi:heavy metal translocating P-type ATPase [Tepidibacter sp.]|uniref:heavy metal translocating P-type ATPase n=1 Tax=Tepidibacter sp. TaxID=2529387 RepID=UPI002ED0EAA2